MVIGMQSLLPHLEHSPSNIDNFSLNYWMSIVYD